MEELLLGLCVFTLLIGLVVWRLRVKQQQDEDRIWTTAMHQNAGEPWPWPKSDK
jgi:hypothetical protein